MGFQTPKYALKDILQWTTSGKIQLPDFQRGYKWEDERIRQLLVSILRHHPLGVVMMLEADNANVRFKPRPVEGVDLDGSVEPDWLLLDGQQRLTSLTQALTGDGLVNTKDDRGKVLSRRYYLHLPTALEGEESMDAAVKSVAEDGRVTTNFGRDVILDISDRAKEQLEGYFPLRLLYDPFAATTWLSTVPDTTLMPRVVAEILTPAGAYAIPAIELDDSTSKAAVATVFEKVNTGGLPLNVFELLTAVFAGDKKYFEQNGDDFRLNEDWAATQAALRPYPVLSRLENTDFLQMVSLAASAASPRATTARKEDILNLKLQDYLTWAPHIREALVWVAHFLNGQHIHTAWDVPYPKQVVPMAVIKVILGDQADTHGVWKRLSHWFWSGVLGELYGGAIETRFARDVEQVPAWARAASTGEQQPRPRTVEDANFFQSRLHSLRTRNSAAYKGIYALLMAQNTRDWLKNQRFDHANFQHLDVDIHHIFPKAWCAKHSIDDERRESIVNKTPLGRQTNIKLGGNAPSAYLRTLENAVGVTREELDSIVAAHQINVDSLRHDDFDGFFIARREALSLLIEQAMGKKVAKDLESGVAQEDSAAFDMEPEHENKPVTDDETLEDDDVNEKDN